MAAYTPADLTDWTTDMAGSQRIKLGDQSDATDELDGWIDLKSLQHIIAPFITQTVDDADTFTPFESGSVAPDTRIVACAFQPVNATDTVTAYPSSATTVTFVGTGSGHSGYLHMWLNR